MRVQARVGLANGARDCRGNVGSLNVANRTAVACDAAHNGGRIAA
jgi:hypothetical protein